MKPSHFLLALALAAALHAGAEAPPFMTLIVNDPADKALAAALERYPSCFDAVAAPADMKGKHIFRNLPDERSPSLGIIMPALSFAQSPQPVASLGGGEGFASGATAHGLCVKAFLLFAYGAEGLEFDFMRAGHEPPAWYANTYFSELAFWRPFLQSYVRHNQGTRPGGLLPCVGKEADLNLTVNLSLAPLGVPLCPGSPYPVGYLLSAEDVASLGDVELQRVLSGGVLLDGGAVAKLQERGYGEKIQLTAKPAQYACERFTDDELNVDRVGYAWKRTVPSPATPFALFPATEAARVIGRYETDGGQTAEAASVLIELPSGGRLAAFGFDGFSPCASEARRRQLLLAADWAAQHRLPVFVENAAHTVVIPRVTQAGDLRSVLLLNASIDTQPPVTLRLRGCPDGLTHIEWLTPKDKPVALAVRWEGEDALVVLPALTPWQVGWLR